MVIDACMPPAAVENYFGLANCPVSLPVSLAHFGCWLYVMKAAAALLHAALGDSLVPIRTLSLLVRSALLGLKGHPGQVPSLRLECGGCNPG